MNASHVAIISTEFNLRESRGEREDILHISIFPDETESLKILEELFVKGTGDDSNKDASKKEDKNASRRSACL